MRTTINLDADVLQAVRAVAQLERKSLGRVISDLVRRGMAPTTPRIADEDGFPVFQVEAGAAPITNEMVQAALDQ